MSALLVSTFSGFSTIALAGPKFPLQGQASTPQLANTGAAPKQLGNTNSRNQPGTLSNESRSGGKRGNCVNEPQAAVKLLQPQGVKMETTLDTPVIPWFTTVSRAFEVGIDDQQTEKELLSQEIPLKQITARKLNSFSIPNSAALVPGKVYTLTVSLICNTKDRSQDAFEKMELTRVAPTADLVKAIQDLSKNTQTPGVIIAKARLYQKSGYWYDAISTLLAVPRSQPIQAELVRMLDQAGLKDIAAAERR
ncbi:hypothetical protein BST81_03025 [Leptolyngbya sp. 'hensonii']|nr:hypothetical protein BST81_03025 [Leptolyngbya sp. 'hensonii']